jgi:hypothetical protein
MYVPRCRMWLITVPESVNSKYRQFQIEMLCRIHTEGPVVFLSFILLPDEDAPALVVVLLTYLIPVLSAGVHLVARVTVRRR